MSLFGSSGTTLLVEVPSRSAGPTRLSVFTQAIPRSVEGMAVLTRTSLNPKGDVARSHTCIFSWRLLLPGPLRPVIAPSLADASYETPGLEATSQLRMRSVMAPGSRLRAKRTTSSRNSRPRASTYGQPSRPRSGEPEQDVNDSCDQPVRVVRPLRGFELVHLNPVVSQAPSVVNVRG